jgi:hypothetical protein
MEATSRRTAQTQRPSTKNALQSGTHCHASLSLFPLDQQSNAKESLPLLLNPDSSPPPRVCPCMPPPGCIPSRGRDIHRDPLRAPHTHSSAAMHARALSPAPRPSPPLLHTAEGYGWLTTGSDLLATGAGVGDATTGAAAGDKAGAGAGEGEETGAAAAGVEGAGAGGECTSCTWMSPGFCPLRNRSYASVSPRSMFRTHLRRTRAHDRNSSVQDSCVVQSISRKSPRWLAVLT